MCLCVCVVPDYYTPAMLGLKTDQEVLGELVRVKIPGVWRTMTDNSVMWTLVVSRWFICLFIDVLPVEVSEPWTEVRMLMLLITRIINRVQNVAVLHSRELL